VAQLVAVPKLLPTRHNLKLDPATTKAHNPTQTIAQVERAIASQVEAAERQEVESECRARTAAVESILQAHLKAQLPTSKPDPSMVGALLMLACEAISEQLGMSDSSRGWGGARAAAAGGRSAAGDAAAANLVTLIGYTLSALSSTLRNSSDGAPTPAAVREAVQMADKLRSEVGKELARRVKAGRQPPTGVAAVAAALNRTGRLPSPTPGEPSPMLLPCLMGLEALAGDVARIPVGGDRGGGGGSSGGGSNASSSSSLYYQPDDGAEAMHTTLAELRFKVAGQVAEATAAVAMQTMAAVDALRTRQRAEIVLRRAKALTSPGDAAALAVEGLDPSRPSAPVKRLAYCELYLRQLGGRPLAAALPDLHAFLTAMDAEGRGLSGGLELEAACEAATRQLRTLVDEIALIEGILKLELGSETASTLGRVTEYLQRLQARSEAAGGPEAAVAAAAEAAAARGPLLGGAGGLGGLLDDLSWAKEEEQAAVARCRELIGDLAANGLIPLGLTASQYRALQVLRDAVAALRRGEAQQGAYERAVGELKGGLGPLAEVIGVASKVRVGW